MDKSLRNQLRNTVTAARKLLEGAISERLEGQFGIFPNGKVEDIAQLGHLSAEDQGYRQQLVIHLEHIWAGGLKPKDAAEQLIREVAFTHLNRLCAYKLMEARGLIRESVSRGVKSQGFFFYLADHPEDEALANVGDTEKAYRHFLRWLSSSLSEELGALFAPDDPADRLYPPLRVLDQVLEMLNAEELKAIWTEDETIGWVYQYFTPKELREQARKESSAPRNSYELAFRNQFYTPRYVVEFLTDNTLGRTWYEMRQGNTGLVETCRYLVRRPNEIWLKEGEEVDQGGAEDTGSEKTQEELLKEPVHIPFRALKDPRDLKILDPACGSGHFLLYCFDLLERIYAEAWQDCPQVFTDLRGNLSEAEFLRRVPGMILRHNLHGIDIDLRATQIASLALWLRAQKAYQALGLRREERPRITRANIVCAEPMPGELDLLEEFCRDLQPPLIGQLVKTIFEKMKLAGEAGSLLKIEQELEEAIQAAKVQMDEQPQAEQLAFWPAAPKPKQMAFDLRGIAKSDAEFWQTVEKRVLEALQEYAARAVNGQGYRRKLFAGDAAQGLAFVDLCRRRYDVILMNPPFGSSVSDVIDFKARYPVANNNLFAAFVERGKELLFTSGFIGCITDRAFIVKETYEDFRNYLVSLNNPCLLTDLGWGVLDEAFVEVAAYVISNRNINIPSLFIDLREDEADQKAILLSSRIEAIQIGDKSISYLLDLNFFRELPHTSFSYWIPNVLKKLFMSKSSIESKWGACKRGMSSGNTEFACRLVWEVPVSDLGYQKNWNFVNVGGGFDLFYRSTFMAFYYRKDWGELRNFPGFSLKNTDYFWKPGIAWGKRTDVLSTQFLPGGQITAEDGQFLIPFRSSDIWLLLAVLNSTYSRVTINAICGGHKGPGYLSKIPVPETVRLIAPDLEERVLEIYSLRRKWHQLNEPNLEFLFPANIQFKTLNSLNGEYKKDEENFIECLEEIDQLVCKNILGDEVDEILKISPRLLKHELISKDFFQDYYPDTFSYIVGSILGRWDVRIARDRDNIPQLGNPNKVLPSIEHGALVGIDGLFASRGGIVSEAWLRARPDAITLPEMVGDQVVGKDGQLHPATIPDEEYPIRIAWDGILVDDPDHPDDIVTRSHEVLELLFPGRGEAVEQEACQVLGVKTLREYFGKPGAGGFWMDHVKRYSKSRRKAPIYWLLQSNRKNYALWLYYHRLDKDLLFKALTQYVEPKIRLEEEHLKTLRAQRGTFGTGGRQAKELDQAMERQEDLLVELEDFRDKLRRAADLGLEPDLNDGVVLNVAPLWELVPWNEAKKYWQELLDGKYEWSSIGKQLRAKGLVK